MRNMADNFLWGAATAAYQIEGGYQEDGRTESIWDRFSRTPGNIYENQNGDIACDHYHRYDHDVKLMADLGIQSYRFSVSWPRIMTEEGKLNEKGLDFYKRLIEALHRHQIAPAITIYHWDLPQWLQDRGGWANRETVKYYVAYAETLFKHLGDSVSMWTTHNEPWCAAFLGYAFGVHAPGRRDWREALAASHHLLLSHGEAVQAYRSFGLDAEIGITLNLAPTYAATHLEKDQAAKRRSDGFSNRWFLDPIFKGVYPDDMVQLFTDRFGTLDFIHTNDLVKIHQPIDFLGVNYYTSNVVADGDDDPVLHITHIEQTGKKTDMGWDIYPKGLYDLLVYVQKHYTDLPLFITENGAAFPDNVVNGRIDDHDRIDYLHAHLKAAQRFIQEGGNLKGYYVWSLLDNFEWAYGYAKRFGIIYVDFETQKRIVKESGRWYQKLIQNGPLKSLSL